jgi:hypothetical protein
LHLLVTDKLKNKALKYNKLKENNNVIKEEISTANENHNNEINILKDKLLNLEKELSFEIEKNLTEVSNNTIFKNN